MPTLELPPEDVFANAKKIRFVLAHLGRFRAALGRPLKVLDFGCGNAEMLGQYIIDGETEYLGVDLHQESLDYARDHFGGGRARFGLSVPEGETFDAVIFSEVLEHLDDPAAILLQYIDHLAPGGAVIASVPNGYGLTEIEKYVDQKLGLCEKLRGVYRWSLSAMGRQPPGKVSSVPYNYDSGHVQFFTKPALRRIAATAGLKIVDFKHGSVMGADLSGATILRPRVLINLNTWLADFVPSWAAATWHFVLIRQDDPVPAWLTD